MTEIPNAFGGFAPFPNTIMIPTMGLQSDVIGFRFGFGYEKGKRTLRAMSNEQFNTLTEEAEQAIYKEHDTTAINFFKMEMFQWVDLQKIIIEKSVEIEVMKAIRTPSAFREIFEGFTKGFSKQQTDDASNFFSSVNDTMMKLIGFFSGGKAKTSPVIPGPTIQEPFSPDNPTPFTPNTPTKPITLKQPTIPTPVRKIKAGQTQIMARKAIIKNIVVQGNEVKKWLAQAANTKMTPQRKNFVNMKLNFRKKTLLKAQQALVNLLSRYRF